jgi:hypothetical protein
MLKKTLKELFSHKNMRFYKKTTQKFQENQNFEKITEETLKKHFEDLKSQIRETHIEQHLIGIFFPFEHQNAYFTVFSINNELSKIKSSDHNASMIRMLWWKENINLAIQGTPPNVPVLLCLSAIAKQYSLKSLHFRQIIKWREIDIKWKQPPSLKSIEDYSEGTYSQILYILLIILNIKDSNAEHAAVMRNPN